MKKKQTFSKRHIFVAPAQVSFCEACGKVVPWGNRYCRGHSKMKPPYKNRKCSRCGSTTTYTYTYKGLKEPWHYDTSKWTSKLRFNKPSEQWRRDKQGNLMCHACYNKEWYSDNQEYMKIR